MNGERQLLLRCCLLCAVGCGIYDILSICGVWGVGKLSKRWRRNYIEKNSTMFTIKPLHEFFLAALQTRFQYRGKVAYGFPSCSDSYILHISIITHIVDSIAHTHDDSTPLAIASLLHRLLSPNRASLVDSFTGSAQSLGGHRSSPNRRCDRSPSLGCLRQYSCVLWGGMLLACAARVRHSGEEYSGAEQ